ncbi:STAS domain-containing protein [Sphingobium subterraneum]|uniref:Anti-anti-sigma regulatory factor n=1 Tax=Sphingobium subterraneum TaxID=627688 RepID=A0A841IYK5_9SPHN|nr:STAS domain-containing protein [Sphingobium subterraneum]MBB6123494.1 anti-anti-sigma regulatory factor [Sphingobium subterraneum]
MDMIILPPVIDRTTASALLSQLDQAISGKNDVVVEGRDVTRIGQAGLQLLLSAQLTAASRGVAMTVHASHAMQAAADLTGLTQTFSWVGDSHDQ